LRGSSIVVSTPSGLAHNFENESLFERDSSTVSLS